MFGPDRLGAREAFTLRVMPEHLANRFKDGMLPQATRRGPHGGGLLAGRTVSLDEVANVLVVALLEVAVAQRALRPPGQRYAKFHGRRPG